MSKSVEVIISSEGDIKIDAHGFTGTDCDKATKFLEMALGAVDRKRKKPEYDLQAGNQRKAVK